LRQRILGEGGSPINRKRGLEQHSNFIQEIDLYQTVGGLREPSTGPSAPLFSSLMMIIFIIVIIDPVEVVENDKVKHISAFILVV